MGRGGSRDHSGAPPGARHVHLLSRSAQAGTAVARGEGRTELPLFFQREHPPGKAALSKPSIEQRLDEQRRRVACVVVFEGGWPSLDGKERHSGKKELAKHLHWHSSPAQGSLTILLDLFFTTSRRRRGSAAPAERQSGGRFLFFTRVRVTPAADRH